MNKKRKERDDDMTETIENIKYYLDTEEVNANYQNPKLDIIYDFLKLKSIAEKSKEKINKYVGRNNNVRNGQVIIKGTRITTKELLSIMSEYSNNEEISKEYKNVYDYIFTQYPSIDNESQIIYGILYEVLKMNKMKFILRVWLTK